MMILPGACIVTFGHMLHDRKKGSCQYGKGTTTQWCSSKTEEIIFGRQGAVVFGAMAVIFMIGLTLCYNSELAGNPVISEMGIDQCRKYGRKGSSFGIAQSSLVYHSNNILYNRYS